MFVFPHRWRLECGGTVNGYNEEHKKLRAELYPRLDLLKKYVREQQEVMRKMEGK